MLAALKKLDLPVEVRESKLVLIDDWACASKGSPLTAAQAKMLFHLDMRVHEDAVDPGVVRRRRRGLRITVLVGRGAQWGRPFPDAPAAHVDEGDAVEDDLRAVAQPRDRRSDRLGDVICERGRADPVVDEARVRKLEAEQACPRESRSFSASTGCRET